MDGDATFSSADEITAQNAGDARASSATAHGLTASGRSPIAIEQRRDDLLETLVREIKPTSALERILVAEIARHTTMLEFAADGEAATLRVVAAEGQGLAAALEGIPGAAGDAGNTSPADMAMAATITSDAVERVTRYRRAHERGLQSALDRLEKLQSYAIRPADPVHDFVFGSEQECTDYLQDRCGTSTWNCPRCRNRTGYWISARQVWECRCCRKQTSLRAGTVMQDSALPLLTWFCAIELLAGVPDISSRHFREAVGIHRRATVNSVREHILDALESPDADRLLVGLPTFLAGAPASSAHGLKKMQNESVGSEEKFYRTKAR